MDVTRRVYVFAVAGLLALATVASADTYVEKGLKNPGTHHVIITVTPGHENDVLATLKKHGSQVRSQHPSINGVAADIDGADVADLATHGAVTITADSLVHGSGESGRKDSSRIKSADISNTNKYLDPAFSTLRASLGLTVGSPDNLSGDAINGSGVGIAIIDSGIALSDDFEGRVIKWKDYVQAKPLPYDDFGHGTHIAGLIASSGKQSGYMFQGVAPRANLIVLKVLDQNGASTSSRVITAIDYVIAHRRELGIQIINLSLGHPITTPAQFDPLVQAVQQAAQRGLTVVVAAGNDGPGYGTVNSPGNAPSAITVGAADGVLTVTRSDDYVIGFSGRGPTWYDGFAKPDVVAPGVNLFSNAAPNSTLANKTPDQWKETVVSAPLIALSGTSMAAAVATGVVALEADANTHQNKAPLTPNTAKAILEYTAIKIHSAPETDALTQGAGQINAAGAIQLAGSINTTAPIGTQWLVSPISSTTSTIVGQDYEWSDNIIWGTNELSGSFMYYNARMWDDNIIWGTGMLQGTTLVGSRAKANANANVKALDDNIIWGTNITGHQNLVWGAEGDNILWGTSTSLGQFRVIGERVGGQIVWNRSSNFVWTTLSRKNIVWGTDDGDNIIWGTWDGDNILWGTTADASILSGTSNGDDNILWGTSANKSILKANNDDNILWGTVGGKLVVMSREDGDNIIWGTADGDNILWGTSDDNILWGTDGDNILWGTDDDNILWGTSVGLN